MTTATTRTDAVARLLDAYREADPRAAHRAASDRQALIVAALLAECNGNVMAVAELLCLGDKRIYQRRVDAAAVRGDDARLARALAAGPI